MSYKFKQGANADSQLKCVIYQGADRVATLYSFDGRKGLYSNKNKYWDEEKQFTAERGMIEIIEQYNAFQQPHDYAYIATSDYDGSRGEILKVLKNDRAKSPTLSTPSITSEFFIYKLVIYDQQNKKFVLFNQSGFDQDTGEVNMYQALLSVVAQLSKFQKQNPLIKLKPNGYLYGGSLHRKTDKEVPQVPADVCTTTCKVFRKKTKTLHGDFQTAQALYQD